MQLLYKFLFITVITFQFCQMSGQDFIDPILRYTFDNGSVHDEVGDSKLFLRNNTDIFDDPQRGNVLRFSSSDKSYAAFDKNPLVENSTTISFYFYWETLQAGSWHQLFEMFDANTNTNLFFTPQNGWGGNQSSLIHDNKEYELYEAINARAIEKEKWIHVAITFEGRLCSLYYDGIQVAKGNLSLPLTELSADSLFLGGNPHRSDNFYISARIDEIKIFDQALAPNQIEALSKNISIPAPEMENTNWDITGETITLNLNLEDKKQVIQNFGASDGWNTERIGKYWPEEKKEHLAELLFSTEKDENGNPKGIGLSAWRFNIGAGTAEQGENSRISIESRRTEGFLNDDGQTYDWNKQIGQQWFLKKAALDYDIHHIIGWQNSPPVAFTKNNLGFRDFGTPTETILEKEHFDDFANFLADVVDHFAAEGINFDYISPLNEPQYAWSPSEQGGSVTQEGSPWTNDDIYEISLVIADVFEKKGLNTKFFLSEAGSISHIDRGNGHASDQLNKFWNKSSTYSLVNHPSFANIVSFHSYWQDSGNALLNERINLNTKANLLDPIPEIWQTEYSLLGLGYRSGYPDNYKLSEMETGLALARVMVSDLNLLNVTGWQWWTTFEAGKHSGESRFSLIEAITKTDNTDGTFHLNKLFYTMGHFSHFIRPGMIRIGIERSDDLSLIEETNNLMFTSFTNAEEDKLVLVAINHSDSARKIKVDIDNKVLKNLSFFLTNDYNNLSLQDIDDVEDLIIPSHSIVSITGNLETISSVKQAYDQTFFKAWYDAGLQEIKVQLTDDMPYEAINLYSIDGKVIQTFKFAQNKQEIYIPAMHLSSGNYVISVKGDEFNESKLISIIKN